MRRLVDALIAGAVLLLARLAPRRRHEEERERLVPPPPEAPRAAGVAALLLVLAMLCALAFPVVYALDRLPAQPQLLGLALGLAFLFLAAALGVAGRGLVSQEELSEEYPQPGAHEQEREEVAQLVEEGGEPITRRRLLVLTAGGAGAAIAVALVTPALSLGPAFETGRLRRGPWRAGRRLVDEAGRPIPADGILEETFYTAFPAGASRERLDAPLVVVRLDPEKLDLPQGRDDWAPDGIVAYSKICTHAACAVSEYRVPLFEPTAPGPALVCPCHYSTFDPAAGGTVLFGPAGRPLPQLPLTVDANGYLVAGGPFSGPVGPSWWGVRLES